MSRRLSNLAAQAGRALARRKRPLVAVVSAAGHMLALLVLFAQPEPPPAFQPEPMTVQLVELPRPPAVVISPAPEPGPTPAPDPAPSSPPPTPDPPKPAKAPPKKALLRPTPKPLPTKVEPAPASEAVSDEPNIELSAAQIAGAATVGSGSGTGAGSGSGGGGGGGSCNMLRYLESELRKDRRVQAATAAAHEGTPILVWNGDWIRRRGQEGAGLAAVREAIMWEVGFAPEACRNQRVRGLVMISLDDSPGSARIVLGSGEWRWSDLLFARGARRETLTRR